MSFYVKNLMLVFKNAHTQTEVHTRVSAILPCIYMTRIITIFINQNQKPVMVEVSPCSFTCSYDLSADPRVGSALCGISTLCVPLPEERQAKTGVFYLREDERGTK